MAMRLPPSPAEAGEGPQTCRRCDLWKHATQAVEGERGEELRTLLESDLRTAADIASRASS
ncbi:MAG: hypothetical protein QOD56_2732 [Gammaproteobacteria bacterium]|jgi:hypothetical protein|nr:hypothetical protein [Gammaproteobacteria bacterium]